MKLLEGIRVLDLSWGWAGPISTDLMALFGAEVIKLESMKRLDFTRLLRDPMTHAFLSVNRVATFNDVNLNKMSIRLNLKHPRGVEIAKELGKVSDVMVESFSAGAIDRLGLDFESVKKLNPAIIMVSTSANGRTGREAGYLGYAPLFAASSGLGAMTGYSDGPPSEIRATVDAISAYRLFVSIMTALVRRRHTGEGQYIDYSSREAICCLVGDSIMDYFANGRVQRRNGNLDDAMSPHNCYRCKGKDKWVSIAIHAGEEWEAFCKAIGKPEWSRDARFADTYSRLCNGEELDRFVESWTADRTDYEVMEVLQKAGVAAVPAFTGEELFSDPHLNQRGMYQIVEHPEGGTHMVITCSWKLSKTPIQIERDAPLIGEHTEYVLRNILKVPSAEIKCLGEEGILD